MFRMLTKPLQALWHALRELTMPTNKTKLSIVCPAFEEQAVLPLFHRELSAVLAELSNEFDIDIVYVDDGSRDGTLQTLGELAANDQRVRYLSLSRNFGHQAALTAGMDHAQGDVVITMDADLQHPPAVIPQLLQKWQEGYDVVLTIREEDERLSASKRFTSRLFYGLMNVVSDTDIRMSASDFRLMTRKAVKGLVQLREHHRFLRGMVQWLGFSTAEVRFKPDERRAGESKYTLQKMLRFAGDGIFSFSRLPLRAATYVGLIVIAFSLLYSLNWIIHSFLTPDEVDHAWTFLFFSTHLLGGCILLGIGVLGEYVGRIYEQVKERPLYVLKFDSAEKNEPVVMPLEQKAAYRKVA